MEDCKSSTEDRRALSMVLVQASMETLFRVGSDQKLVGFEGQWLVLHEVFQQLYRSRSRCWSKLDRFMI